MDYAITIGIMYCMGLYVDTWLYYVYIYIYIYGFINIHIHKVYEHLNRYVQVCKGMYRYVQVCIGMSE